MIEQPEHTFPVVIIGAGIAGLAAGVHLAERGITPLILESDMQWPGGRLSGGDPDCFEYGGKQWSFSPDHGVHAVWGGYVNFRALLKRFTQTQLQLSPGEEWINRWGRDIRVIEAGSAVRAPFLPAPFHYLNLLFHPQIWANITPLDFLSLPGYLFSTMLAVGFDPIKEKRELRGLMMNEFFRGWTPNLRATFRGLAANLLAAPEDRISLTGFIAALRFYTILRRDMWLMHYLPDNSHNSLIAPLVDAIEQRGGKLKGGSIATRLERQSDGWRIVLEDTNAGGYRSVQAQHVILAAHAPGAKCLLVNSPDTMDISHQMSFPEAVRSVVIRLWFNQVPRPGTPGGMFTGDFAPDNFFWLHRLFPDCQKWYEDAGGSAIELHFYGPENLLDQPDNNLLILAVTEVQRAFPEMRGRFVHGAVRRNSRLHTEFRIPTENSLHVETPWQQLYACGDWIGYDTPSLWMERAVTTGMAAANAVLKANDMEPYPILKPPNPEWTARGLGFLVHHTRNAARPLVSRLRQRRHHRKQ